VYIEGDIMYFIPDAYPVDYYFKSKINKDDKIFLN